MKRNIFTLLFLFSITWSIAQTYSSIDFVGTWNGTYSSEWNYYENEPISMTIYEDGSYIESPGYFMPSIYPNTQQFEYDEGSNRLHWWYLQTVYAGQYTYTHIYYEIISFDGYELVLHYNFWDDPEPNPQAGTLVLYKETDELFSPNSLDFEYNMGESTLTWNAPQNIQQFETQFESYNVYGKSAEGEYVLLGSTEYEFFDLADFAYAGINMYYVTAVYNGMETDATDIVSATFYTPEPEDFTAESESNNVYLSWNAPSPSEMPMATILGYNIYYKSGYNDFELLEFVESTMFYHSYLDIGMHSYYVTVVYQGGESNTSQVKEVSVLALGIEATYSSEYSIYPNPARDYVNINSVEIIENVKIYNNLGQFLDVFNVQQSDYKLNVLDLPSGMYVFVVQTVSEVFTQNVYIE